MYANSLPLSSLLPLFLYLFACKAIVFGQDDKERAEIIRYPLAAPGLFNESELPEAQLSGDFIAELGKVLKLKTITAPKGNKLQTRFDFYQAAPSRLASSVSFMGATYCKLPTLNTGGTYGPYEFDLDRLLAMDMSGRSRRFLIVIPGWLSRWKVGWRAQVREKWLELDGDAGGIAIEVSWNSLSVDVYDRTVANTVLVARQVTILLHYLAELSGTHLMDPHFLARVHLVGHSLGAHIAGFVGKDLYGKLGRITALDPAGPSFDKLPDHQRLHRTDARLVEVMHTNSGRIKYMNLIASASLAAMSMMPFTGGLKETIGDMYSGEGNTAWFGIDAQLGHIDYYANNGRIQPGCGDVLHVCDHNRAPQIYLDLLTYMCALRQSSSTASLQELLESQEGPERANQQAQVNRLRAFKSPDYESFAAGHSFVQHCPELMDIETHLNDTAVLQAFDQCSVPMFDVTKPLDEVIDELKTKHGINFDRYTGTSSNYHRETEKSDAEGLEDDGQLEPGAELRKQPSFYFKTSPDDGDLVGDHFLLKIYLTDKPIGWDEAHCTLEANLIMSDGDRFNLELKRLLHPASNQTVLAMPFVYRKSFEAKNRFNDLMRLIKINESLARGDDKSVASDAQVASREFSRLFGKLFPEKICLKLAKPKASSIFSTVYNFAKKMIKPED